MAHQKNWRKRGNILTKPRALVTGYDGFIGKHLVSTLTAIGIDVDPVTRQAFYEQDQIGTSDTKYIFHLAAYGNHYTQTIEKDTVFTNVVGTFSLLERTTWIDYDAFVNVSTSSVMLPQQTFYSATKSAAEKIAQAYAQRYHKPIVSVRPFSIYGVGEAEHRFIPTVIRALEEKKTINLDPYAVHDWTFVDDFVFGTIAVAQNAKKFTKPVDIGTGEQHTNREIVRILEGISGHKLKYKIQKLRSYDTTKWKANPKPLLKLGWKPEVSLEAGLAQCYEYYCAKNN